jgi:hypothetical protein
MTINHTIFFNHTTAYQSYELFQSYLTVDINRRLILVSCNQCLNCTIFSVMAFYSNAISFLILIIMTNDINRAIIFNRATTYQSYDLFQSYDDFSTYNWHQPYIKIWLPCNRVTNALIVRFSSTVQRIDRMILFQSYQSHVRFHCYATLNICRC